MDTTAPPASEAPSKAGAAHPPPGPGSWRRHWRKMLLALALLAGVSIAVILWREQRNAPKQYVTAAVDRGAVTPTVIASGTVNPVNTIQVGSYVSGVIQTLSCDFNTKVRAGQLCARLDQRPYQSAVDQETANLAAARAQLQKDRANLAFAKLIYERDIDLLRRSIVSQETVDTANNAYTQARSQITLDEATIEQRSAALNAARINLGYTNIVSPVDGTVVARNVTQGQTVAASFQTPTLFLIATDLTRMQVDTNVSESDIGRIAVGNAASFTVEAYPNRSFDGVVHQVRQAPQTVQNVITYDVVVRVDNPARLLMPGMTASARIVTERRDNVLRVPDAALRYLPPGVGEQRGAPAPRRGAGKNGRAAQVWVTHEGKLRRIPILTGLDDDAYAEVLEGDLRAGDQVIVSERAAGDRARGGAATGGPRLPRL
ncbi:efflux RND transporter periplasmic adaptor subunit [Massilia sp. R2A-15]|uniref:efflux RND transporter periplasmic adaptor subunit n=1 Tax=Massilia sp. R2A-15 TaxID=3064278 RepID=UPI002733A16C|nr:efflux RND transporter periplasmic adaptor subunit [Massilia sp. R2A-15]WLI90718.1 efflux RND transporter periplasmic adaptor subunit [Massilia sp. R2A-15]